LESPTQAVPFFERRVAPTLTVMAAAAIMALVVGGAAYGVGAHGEGQFLKNYRPPSDYEAHIALAMRYAQTSTEANDVIFLGDSTCLTGIDPVVFDKLTGLRAYNLSSVGILGIDGLVVMFKKYLEHHPKPRMVVLCPHPWALGVPPAATGPEDIRLEFFRVYDPVSAQAVAAYPGVTSLVRRGFWNLFGLATGGARRYARYPMPRRNGDTLESLGAKVAARRGYWEHPGALASGRRRPGSEDPFPVLATVKAASEALVRVASDNGVTTMVRLTPALPGSASEHFDAIRVWLNGLETTRSTVLVSRPEVLEYDSSDFGEVYHLNGRGAERFTTFVARDVARKLGPR
jgi:hypothetical protein